MKSIPGINNYRNPKHTGFNRRYPRIEAVNQVGTQKIEVWALFKEYGTVLFKLVLPYYIP